MRRSEMCYKNLCIACLLRHSCSTMPGQCPVPAREKNALKSLMPALNKELSGALSPQQQMTLCHLNSTWPDPLGKLRVKTSIIFMMLLISNSAKYFAK